MMSKRPLRLPFRFIAAQLSVATLLVSQVTLLQVTPLRAQVFNPPAAQPPATLPNAGIQQAGGPAVAAPIGAVEQTGWGLPMPKITMPKITMPKVSMPSMGSVTGPIKTGFGKVSAGSKKALEGAKEMLSFGKNRTQTSTINRATGPKKSFWQKLLVRESEPQVPQTVGEFMSQPRLDP